MRHSRRNSGRLLPTSGSACCVPIPILPASWRLPGNSPKTAPRSRPAPEHARFTALNSAYTTKFGFPFIIAVKGLTKDDILSAFETRIDNSRETEFFTACAQVEKIARLRLESLLPEKD